MSKASDEDQKEYILTQINDYQGLIEIYRKKLRTHEDSDDRYYLSQLYYKIGDYSSSNIYLEPLISKSKDKKYLLLQAKNFLELGQDSKAEKTLDELLKNDSENGELWNLQGTMYAQQGKYKKAINSFEKARGLFYNEEIVMNNLAMMAILQQDYATASNYLLSLYSRKQYRPETVYNLVYSLVKMNDLTSARKIIVDEKLTSSDPDVLINSLSRITPREKFNIGNPSSAVAEVQPSNSAMVSKEIENTKIEKPTLQEVIPKPSLPMSSSQDKTSTTCAEGEIPTLPVKAFSGAKNNVKKISKLTSASLEKGSRLGLYSTYSLNYIVLPQIKPNLFEIEFFNVQPDASIYASQLNIMSRHPDIASVEFVNNSENTVLLRIITKQCIVKRSVTRTTIKGSNKEKVLIDFLYHQ